MLVDHAGSSRTSEASIAVDPRSRAVVLLERYTGEGARALQEDADLAAALDHEGIARTLEVGVHNGTAYAVLEHLIALDLAAIFDLCRARRLELPIPIVARIAADAATALAAAHDRRARDGRSLGIVHGGIAPGRLAITAEGRVKISGFADAAILSGLAAPARSRRVSRARAAIESLDVRYVSPEQARGEELDRRSDVFSLGAVMYDLATGVKPLEGVSDAVVLAVTDSCRVVPPSKVSGRVPLSLEQVIAKAIARDRNERWASMNELARALAERVGLAEHRELASWIVEAFGAELDAKRQERTAALEAAENETLRDVERAIPPIDTSPTARTVPRGTVEDEPLTQATLANTIPSAPPEEADTTPSRAREGTLSAADHQGVTDRQHETTLPITDRDRGEHTESLPPSREDTPPPVQSPRIVDPAEPRPRAPTAPAPAPTPAPGPAPAQRPLRWPLWLSAVMVLAALAITARSAIDRPSSPAPPAIAAVKKEPSGANPAPLLTPDRPRTWAPSWRAPEAEAAPRKPLKRAPVEREPKSKPPEPAHEEPAHEEPAGIGRVNIVVKQSGKPIPMMVYVDGRQTDQAPLQLDLTSGKHEVEVRPPNASPISQRITVSAGKTERVVLELSPKPRAN